MYSSNNKKSNECKEGYTHTVIKRDLDNWNGIRKKLTQEVRVEKITEKKEYMTLSGGFCMFFDKRVSKVWIIFCEQKKPPEKEVGYRRVVSYFFGNHRWRKKEYRAGIYF